MMRGEQLFRKFIDEGLSPEEIFELEKLALDDDFLADAWEGIHRINPESGHQILNRLTSRIESKSSGKVIPLYRKVWPYVAAASILLAASLIILNPQSDTLPQHEAFAINMDSEDQERSHKDSPALPTISSEVSDIEKPKSIAPKTTEMPSTEAETSDDLSIALPQNDEVASLSEANTPRLIPNANEQKNDRRGIVEADVLQEQTIQLNGENVTEKMEEESDKKSGSKNVLNNESHLAQSRRKLQEDVANVQVTNQRNEKETSLKESSVSFDSKLQKKRGNLDVGLYKSAKLVQDSLVARPIVGFQKYKEILDQNNTVEKQSLFMRGIKEGTLLNISFNLDNQGNPIDIAIENLSDGPIKDAVILQIQSSGKWSNPLEQIIHYTLPLYGR